MQQDKVTAVCESCIRHERPGKPPAVKMSLRLPDGEKVRYFYVPGIRLHDAIIKKFNLPPLDRLAEVVGASFEVMVMVISGHRSVLLVARHK